MSVRYKASLAQSPYINQVTELPIERIDFLLCHMALYATWLSCHIALCITWQITLILLCILVVTFLSVDYNILPCCIIYLLFIIVLLCIASPFIYLFLPDWRWPPTRVQPNISTRTGGNFHLRSKRLFQASTTPSITCQFTIKNPRRRSLRYDNSLIISTLTQSSSLTIFVQKGTFSNLNTVSFVGKLLLSKQMCSFSVAYYAWKLQHLSI